MSQPLDKFESLQDEYFYIAQNLVTCSQFQTFLYHPQGFDSLGNWKDLPNKYKKQEITTYPYDISNYPRGAISWYQAFAYSRWLDKYLPPNALPESNMRREIWQIRLPMEYEWQKVAKGCCKENIYPWGKNWDSNRCNTSESGLGYPIAVGMYPHGATDTDVFDMCGNLFEWCLNLFHDPLDINPRSEDRRSSRGGAYNYDEASGRVGSRLFIRHSSLSKTPYGFRLCLSKRLFDLELIQ
ncbi:MAG: formylglycine-generating enzyme family protein [Anaerolineae bacterium]|nr:formylglycine-generating enzyme family protein [Anaerolineae bacterium]